MLAGGRNPRFHHRAPLRGCGEGSLRSLGLTN
jgi:hypothetical protein